MPCRSTRVFGRSGLAILAASAILGVFLAVATDRQYTSSYGQEPAVVAGEIWRLPRWVKERRHDAIRVVNDGTALLTGLGLGLALVVLRPRPGRRCSGPFGPGAIAAVFTWGFTLAFAICWGTQLAMAPRIPRSGRLPLMPLSYPRGGLMDLYDLWGLLRPNVAWMILGAWSTLLVTGRWRRPVDGAERLGRWLGLGWLILLLGQAAIHVITWY